MRTETRRSRRALALVAAALLAGPAFAAQPPANGPADLGDLLPPVPCARLASPVVVDGALDDAAWRVPPTMTRLVMLEPYNGGAPSESTWVWFAYDDQALYVAARMFDAHPDSIIAPLFRRDDFMPTDFAGVLVDPFHDHRSGYEFIITPAGSLADAVRSNDTNEDMSWDAVWQGRARRDDQGWTCEMRIPFSQMRFSRGDRQVWGVNFGRCIARHAEKDFAAVPPRSESSFESRWPHLVGIERVRSGHAVELSPYATGKAEYLVRPPGLPTFDPSRYTPAMGADLRAGVGSNLTLNATANPDFGQVEVDPALVNLSDVESYYQEKRPFFTENSHVFTFGQDGATSRWGMNWPEPTFFYSRRIGRAPQGADPGPDVPVATRILGAAKLTGQPAPGWNLGLLQAVTARERTRSADEEIEPPAYYGVVRAQRETAHNGLGLFSTVAERRFEDGAISDRLNRESLMGGLDGWHFLDAEKTWCVTGWGAASRVAGAVARLREIQVGPLHYFQRPDVGYLGVKDATSLAGWAGRAAVSKERGAVAFNSGIGALSPGFDVSDVGYESYADLVNAHVMTGYQWLKPNRWQTEAKLFAYTASNWDFGGERVWSEVGLNGRVRLVNRHFIWAEVDWYPSAIANRLTRGGPGMPRQAGGEAGFEYDTDENRPLSGTLNLWWSGRPSVGTVDWSVGPSVTWKPTSRFRLSVGPTFERNLQDAQFVDQVDAPGEVPADFGGRRYVFAKLDQTTIGAGIRLNVSFTPDLSLQTYLQPFVSAIRSSDFKELARAGTYDFVHYGRDPGTAYDGEWVTPAAGGTRFELNDPSFDYRSVRGNAVLRWEYRPGSVLYFVWTQERTDTPSSGDMGIGPSMRRLLDPRANDIFLVKATYYLAL